MDPTLEQAVQRWHSAGLLADDTVTAIRDHEATRPVPAMAAARGATAPVPPATPPPSAPPTSPPAPPLASASPDTSAGDDHSPIEFVAEALAYVGSALALGFGISLFSGLWQDMSSAGRIFLAAIATLIVGGAAAALDDETRAPIRRLGTVLAALTVVGVGLTTVVILTEQTELDAATIVFTTGLVGLAVGLPVHLRRPSWPTTLALGAALLTSVTGGGQVFDLIVSAAVSGVLLMGVGLAWAALGWSGHMRPRNAFEVTGLIAGGIGVQILAIDNVTTVALIIGVLLSGVILAMSLRERRTPPAILGGLGITVFAPQLVYDLFGEALGAPLAVFVAGIALVAVSVLILRKERLV